MFFFKNISYRFFYKIPVPFFLIFSKIVGFYDLYLFFSQKKLNSVVTQNLILPFSLKLIKNGRLFFKRFFYKKIVSVKKQLNSKFFKTYLHYKNFLYLKCFKNFKFIFKESPYPFFSKIVKSNKRHNKKYVFTKVVKKKVFSIVLNFYKHVFIFPYLFNNNISGLSISFFFAFLMRVFKKYYYPFKTKNSGYLDVLRRNKFYVYFNSKMYWQTIMNSFFFNERI